MVKNWLQKFNFGKIKEENEEETIGNEYSLISEVKSPKYEEDQLKDLFSPQEEPQWEKQIFHEKKIKPFTSFRSEKSSEQEQQEMQRKQDKYLVRNFFERTQFKDKQTRQLMIDTLRLKNLLNEQKKNLEDLLMSVNFMKTQYAIEQSYSFDLQQNDYANYILSSMSLKFQKLENRLYVKVMKLFQTANIIQKEATFDQIEVNRTDKIGFSADGEFQDKELQLVEQMIFSDIEYEEEEDEQPIDMPRQTSSHSIQSRSEG